MATLHFRAVFFGFQEDEDYLLDTASLFLGFGGGYGYNWVPSKHWLLHVSATESLGVMGLTLFKQPFGKKIKGHGRFIPLVTTGNLAVLYYYKNFYGGAFATIDNMFIPSKVNETNDRYRISTTKIQGHLTVGFRF